MGHPPIAPYRPRFTHESFALHSFSPGLSWRDLLFPPLVKSARGFDRMSARLAGKTAVVTAAGQGIGRATAIAFANEGAIVWATDINQAALDTLATEQPGITCRTLDVRDPK